MHEISAVMIDAIKSEDLSKLKKLYTDGVDFVNALDERKQNLLFYAVRQKAYDVLKMLCDYGVNANQKNHFSDTPLHASSYLGDVNLVKILLQAHAEVNALNKKHQTPLMLAALKGNLDCVKYLVNKGANLSLVDHEGNHVLMYAVKSKKLKVVEYLIQAKAPLHLLNDKKESIMHLTAAYGLPSIFDRLLKLGVNAYQKTIYLQTPLHYASTEPIEAMIESLLKIGLNSYDKDRFNESPYDIAHNHHQMNTITLFTRQKNDPLTQKEAHNYPLHTALRFGWLDEALACLHKISDVNQKDSFENTPLFYALMIKDMYMIEILIKKGAKLKDISYTHHDAHFYAVLEQDYTLFELFKNHTKSLDDETKQLIKSLNDPRFLANL